jgi:hypothetical protein
MPFYDVMTETCMLKLPSGAYAERVIHDYYEKNPTLDRGTMWIIDAEDDNLKKAFAEKDWKFLIDKARFVATKPNQYAEDLINKFASVSYLLLI